MWIPAKLAFRGKFIAIKANIRNEGQSQITTVSFFLKKLEGGGYIKSKVKRGTEINKTENNRESFFKIHTLGLGEDQ